MVQNAPHEPRNSIARYSAKIQVSGCLDNSPIVWFWITIGGQYLRTVSLQEPIAKLQWDSQSQSGRSERYRVDGVKGTEWTE